MTPLRKLRKDRGWTVEELARRADVSPSLVWMRERVPSGLKLSTASKLARALGVNVAEILEVK